MCAGWIDRARRELLDRRSPGGAWAYRDAGTPAAEPTAMAALGLIAAGGEVDRARRAASWLVERQRDDGDVPAVPGMSTPGWTTPHALLLWQRLDGFESPGRLARDWLLSIRGKPMPIADGRRDLGHDTRLIGWPWVVGTHSWLEPTALAILALIGEGCRDHPRVRQGAKVLVDRAIPGGGWNYGNNIVFGQALRPQPGPTGLALLALSALGLRTHPVVAPAIAYLHRALPTTRAATTVGWGVLGLAAHGDIPPEADAWLEQAHARSVDRPDATVGLGLLLMAAATERPGGLRCFDPRSSDRSTEGTDR